jgi:tetratricopeptide (TPR) repeat protein
MQTVTASRNPIDRAELPSMLATLCSYENWFGPYHPQTLCLMAQVAFAYCQAGEFDYARPLLERAIRDLGRHVCRDHELRLRAIAILKDFFVAQGDYERAEAFQRELLECHVQRLGSDHPETLDTRSSLAMVLLDRATCDSNREV